MHEFQISGLSARILHFLSVTFPPLHHGMEIGRSGLNFGTVTILSFHQHKISPPDFNTPLIRVVIHAKSCYYQRNLLQHYFLKLIINSYNIHVPLPLFHDPDSWKGILGIYHFYFQSNPDIMTWDSNLPLLARLSNPLTTKQPSCRLL